MWRDVGRGFLKALLDAEGASVWSRLPQSKFRSLDRVRIRRWLLPGCWQTFLSSCLAVKWRLLMLMLMLILLKY